MKEDIFLTSWYLGQKFLDLFQSSINRSGLRREAKGLEQSIRNVSAKAEAVGITSEAGLKRLAGFMAQDILNSFEQNIPDVSQFDAMENTKSVCEVTAFAFYQHLQNVMFAFMANEGFFAPPAGLFDKRIESQSQLWAIEDGLKRVEMVFDNFDEIIRDIAQMFRHFVTPIIENNPSLLTATTRIDDGNKEGIAAKLQFEVPLSMVIIELPKLIERMVQLPFAPEFDDAGTTARIRERLEYNVVLASGGNPADPGSFNRTPRLPSQAPPMLPDHLIAMYLEGTPLMGLFDYAVPIFLPQETRFEHHHIVAGSGHGKTQTLQHLILHDLQQVSRGEASIVVLDSQGDLINNIASLSVFAPGGPLADRLVVIDPTDVEYPIALNLFDVGMERINRYSLLDRERMTNGILELYDFVLGSLLSAEMTQKQSVIFRYITRLLLHIPNATIHTLRVLLEDGGADMFRDSIDKLGGSAKAFFDSEFDSREFVQTKRQVVRRLWGILENQTFERMFSHPKNKLDLYTEMNSGKVILINTAKDLLKENGTEIFGRFFIAMIAQAAQERSVIPENQRMPTTVYIDEAQDYFDQNIGVILSQARKYKIGMVLAHQYLGQLDYKLQEAIFANTSIKFAGGVSAKDARALAGEMRCDASFIERHDKLSFAAFIRGTTKNAISLSITPGTMEQLPHMNQEQLQHQRQIMRDRYAIHYKDVYTQSADNNDECKAEESDASTQTNNQSAYEHSHSNKAPLSGKPANWE